MLKGKQRKQAEIRLHEVVGIQATQEQVELVRLLAKRVADGEITLDEAIAEIRDGLN